MLHLFKLELKRQLKTRWTFFFIGTALITTLLFAYFPVSFYEITLPNAQGQTEKLTGFDALHAQMERQAPAGGTVTPEKVRAALENYQDTLNAYDAEFPSDLPEGVYEKSLLPTDPLLHGVVELYSNPKTGIGSPLTELTPQKIDSYYTTADAHIQALMALEHPENEVTQQQGIAMYQEVAKPFVSRPNASSDAIDYFLLLSFVLMLLCAVLAAPVFASDYQTRADDIQRSCKNGRNTLAIARIIATLFICTLLTLSCQILYWCLSNTFFGWDALDASIQMMALFPISALANMTFGELQIFLVVVGQLGMLATVSAVLLISSKTKNLVTATATALFLCVLPVLLYLILPTNLRIILCTLLPSSVNAMQSGVLYAMREFFFITVGDLAIWLPWLMTGVVCLEVPLFALFARHSYSKHEVH